MPHTATRHTADSLRYLLDSPAGILEARIRADHAFLVHHQPDCDADHCDDQCDAETGQGDEVALMFQASGSDNAVWAILRDHAIRADLADLPQPAHEPTFAQRDFAARLAATPYVVGRMPPPGEPFFPRPGNPGLGGGH